MAGKDTGRGFRWSGGLLAEEDPDPVGHERPESRSGILILVDHAGQLVPVRLQRLGLTVGELDRHIAWDIGALGVAKRLSAALDAELIYQRYSRLVIDCNRPLHVESAFVTQADGSQIHANAVLGAREAGMRVAEIFHPYHAAIAAALDRRHAEGQPTALVSIHSFTPSHGDHPAPRPWQISVLFNRDDRLGLALAGRLEADGDVVVGVNEPYVVDDEGDYSIPVHAEARGLAHVEIEIRQDLIAADGGQADWAGRLARLIPAALEKLGPPGAWTRATARADVEGIEGTSA